MKFRVKYERQNKVLMTSIFMLCLLTCIFWLLLPFYIYALVYFVITLILSYTYYRTIYILNNDGLVIKMGFIPVKLKYQKIKSIKRIDNKIKVNYEHFSVTIYPDNIDIFMVKLNEFMGGK